MWNSQVKLTFKSDDEKLLIGYFFDSATFDGVGRNIDSMAFLNIEPGQSVRLFPFNMFEGSDTKSNIMVEEIQKHQK